jgi:hypothetical protein
MRIEPCADGADEDDRPDPRGLGRLTQDSRPVDVDREVRLRAVTPDRDEADDVLRTLGGLEHRLRVQRVADGDLRTTGFVRRGLHRVADQDAQLVAGVDEFVGDGAAHEPSRSEKEYPSHG